MKEKSSSLKKIVNFRHFFYEMLLLFTHFSLFVVNKNFDQVGSAAVDKTMCSCMLTCVVAN